VRVDHVAQAGVELRADAISINALGQKIQADLSAAY
jgi:hypothetical protein